MNDKVAVTIRVSKELKRKLKVKAMLENTSVSEILTKLAVDGTADVTLAGE